jgi:hypothetical protein
MYAKCKDVQDGLNCKHCQHAVLTDIELLTLNGLYCNNCRARYDCGGAFDSNSQVLYKLLASLIPTLELISLGKGIRGSKTPWSGYMVKPDIVFHYSQSMIVVVEADEDDGHSATSRGSSISKWGDPWKYSRDLNAELAKMKTGSQALYEVFKKKILYVRCNSDNISSKLGDAGLATRAQIVVDKIIAAQSCIQMWPTNCFRLALVDMPLCRSHPGTAIRNSRDVYISWLGIQQTITPNNPAEIRRITENETLKRNQRRAQRYYINQ